MEINPNHELILNMNLIRKKNPKFASLAARNFLDAVMTQAGIPFPISDTISRSFDLINTAMELKIEANDEPSMPKVKKPSR